MSLGLAIPFYNEEAVAERVVSEIATALLDAKIPYRIAMVDNGSADETGKILDRLASDSQLEIVSLDKNMGYGGGIIAGLEHLGLSRSAPSPRVLGWTQGDGQADPGIIEDLYRACMDGAMMAKTLRLDRPDGAARHIMRTGYKTYLSLLGVKNHDVNGTPKLFRCEALEELSPLAGGWALDTEAVLRAEHRQWEIFEKSVEWRKRHGGASKLRPKAMLAGIAAGLRWQVFQRGA